MEQPHQDEYANLDTTLLYERVGEEKQTCKKKEKKKQKEEQDDEDKRKQDTAQEERRNEEEVSDETIDVKREDRKEPFSEKMKMEDIHFNEKGHTKVMEGGPVTDSIKSAECTGGHVADSVVPNQFVSMINNFFPKEGLLHFTKPQGFEKEPKLHPELFQSLYDMINMEDLHPVKLCMHLENHPGLIKNYTGIVKLFDILLERRMEAGDINEQFGMQAHYYSFLFKTVGKEYKENIKGFIKSLIKGREFDGFPEFQEKFLRKVLRTFPYARSNLVYRKARSHLLYRMVQTLANTKIGDHPTALLVMYRELNLPRYIHMDDACCTCGTPKNTMKCSKCRMVSYCGQRCQKLHWSSHRKHCKQKSDQLTQILCQEMFQEADKDRLLTSPVLQKCITVKGVHRCTEISLVTSGMFWVSNKGNVDDIGVFKPVKLILSDTEGNTLDQITDTRGNHTLSKNRDLIYIADNGNIIKLSYDMKKKPTVVTKTDWMPCSVFCSKFLGDVLVGMIENVPGQNYICDGVSSTIKGKITRYFQNGLHIQTIEYDETGQRLFMCPKLITENKNGDVIVSEGHRLVVINYAGKYRFSYRGPPFGMILLPFGVCTDALSNILVCDGRTNTVQMIDKDGKFLSFLLTERTPGITSPWYLSYDVNTNFLWVGSKNSNTIFVYKYINDQLTQMLCQEMFQEADKDRLLTLMSSPVLQKCITVKGLNRCTEISLVTSGMFWVSNKGSAEDIDAFKPVKLILSDTEGNTLAQITDARCYWGVHTMSKNRDLIYIADNGNIIKLSNDMKTKTTVATKTDWIPFCLFCSKSSGDVLVGMIINVPGQKYTYDGVSSTVKGKITRYYQHGLHIQTVEYDHAGQRLFMCPRFITENNNGDVIVSEGERLVVIDYVGKYRFSYRGPQFGEVLFPMGVCTDALSNILVCDERTNTVQMIDKDGKFLSFLLTEKTLGKTSPWYLSYDVNTNFLWVGSKSSNTIFVYKYINDQRDINDGAEINSESVGSAKIQNIIESNRGNSDVQKEHHSHHVSREEVENLKMKQEIEKSWKNEGIHLKDELWIQAKTALNFFRRHALVFNFVTELQYEKYASPNTLFSIYSVGSLVEGTNITGSDSDMLYIWKKVMICRNVDEVPKTDGAVFVMERSNSPPGYTKLRLVEKQTAEENILIEGNCIKDVVETTKMGKYLSNTKVIECFAQYKRMQGRVFIERNGPCVTSDNLDMAQGFELCNITEEGKQWLHVMDSSNMERIWPSPLVIEKIKKLKCHVVSVGGSDKRIPGSSLNWRLSYTFWEKELVCSFHDVQFFCFLYMKMLNRKKLNVICHDVSSFHIKNVVFWESIECSQDLFQFKNLRTLIQQCLVRLQTAVKEKRLSHFIDRERNLFESKLQDENDRQNLILFLDNVEQIVGTFDQIYKECMDQISSQKFLEILNIDPQKIQNKTHAKYAGMHVDTNQKLSKCEEILQNGFYSFWNKSRIFRNVVHSSYRSFTIVYECFDQFQMPDSPGIECETDMSAEIMRNMNESGKLILDAIEKLDSDQETLDKMKKDILFRFGISAATFRIYWDKKRTQMKPRGCCQIEDTFICEKLQQHTDALSGLLYLCTYYVQEKMFLEANSIIDDFLTSDPKLLVYSGMCSTYNGIEVGNGMATFVQYECSSLDVTDEAFPYVHDIIALNEKDTFFFPPIVQIQILLEGDFLINPVVYLYFLKVICGVGLNRNVDNSLKRLRDTVCDFVNDKNLQMYGSDFFIRVSENHKH
uniref:Uncharacterized protein LOC111103591 isoform X2 n=1 Tax=Crassostrea virginica TaxID=6565 RepID=A0A8B8AR68_CRAVI|nr:uncharacterized protein LOC111103591 isoform X2 [Crassostrea virginica]